MLPSGFKIKMNLMILADYKMTKKQLFNHYFFLDEYTGDGDVLLKDLDVRDYLIWFLRFKSFYNQIRGLKGDGPIGLRSSRSVSIAWLIYDLLKVI